LLADDRKVVLPPAVEEVEGAGDGPPEDDGQGEVRLPPEGEGSDEEYLGEYDETNQNANFDRRKEQFTQLQLYHGLPTVEDVPLSPPVGRSCSSVCTCRRCLIYCEATGEADDRLCRRVKVKVKVRRAGLQPILGSWLG